MGCSALGLEGPTQLQAPPGACLAGGDNCHHGLIHVLTVPWDPRVRELILLSLHVPPGCHSGCRSPPLGPFECLSSRTRSLLLHQGQHQGPPATPHPLPRGKTEVWREGPGAFPRGPSHFHGRSEQPGCRSPKPTCI